jgi:lysophospholipase L1-like esterase
MPKTILAFGDSNTFGTPPMPDLEDARRFDRKTRWPCVMVGELGNDFVLVEEGLPGRTTLHDDPIEGAHKNGLKLLPALLESHQPIDVMTVMLGTNDLKARFSLPAFDIATSVGLIVETVMAAPRLAGAPQPRLILIAPPPIIETGCLAEMFAGGTEKSRRLGTLYAKTAESFGVAFVDAGTVARVSPVDGIHWEAEEHIRFGRHMAGVVRMAASA